MTSAGPGGFSDMAEPYPGAYSLPPNFDQFDTTGGGALDVKAVTDAASRLSDAASSLGNWTPSTGQGVGATIPENAQGGGGGAVNIPGATFDSGSLFIRATVIITGFIFLAIGLAMFKGPSVIMPAPIKEAASALS